MRLQARGWDAFVYVAHLLGEAGVAGTPMGANAIDIDDGDVDQLDDEVRAELAAYTVDSPFAASPPVDGDGPETGDAAAPQVGHQPLGPQSQSPLRRPPKTGTGSGRKAWARYALSLNITVLPEMGRDDIVRAVEDQERGR